MQDVEDLLVKSKEARTVASFPGVEEGEECLVHTVCACAKSPRKSVETVFVRVCVRILGDVINSHGLTEIGG